MKKTTLYILMSLSFLEASFEELLQNKPHILEKKHIIHQVKQTSKTYTAFVILDINQNINKAFLQIINFKDYPSRISKIDSIKIYEQNEINTKVRFTFSGFFMQLNDYYIHYINNQNHTLTWEIDKQKKSELLLLSNGKWELKKISKNKTRVFYKNTISVQSWIPSILVNYLIKNSALDATKWLL